MNRRDLLRLGSSLLVTLPVASCRYSGKGDSSAESGGSHIFFAPEDVDRIRANARTPLLAPVLATWKAEPIDQVNVLSDKMVASGNIIYDLRDTMQAMTRSSVCQLVDPDPQREASLRYGLQALLEMEKWDYMEDGGTEVIGLMRASMVTVRLLFLREVLGTELSTEEQNLLLDHIAEKGCLPCYRTIYDMDHPETVKGWGFDEAHQSVMEIDMSKWPVILGANNLRAIPTMGLGLGALALQGRDERVEQWLQAAEGSTRQFFSTFSPDGGYFEGLSYVDYALRTLLGFLDAHQRLRGNIDWTQELNFSGVLDFILALQAGKKSDGNPDIVNFSDSRKSVYPCIPAWIGRRVGDPRAQYAVENVSEPGYYLDFLWYEPGRSITPPSEALKNKLLDLEWIIARTGWEAEDAVLAFRSGGPANHEHADRNSFLYKVYGERLLTDHFGAAYDWRQPGWLLRLTEAHNAVLIDGKGHQYHNGEEGTNEGLAVAKIVAYEDQGDRIWWVSDVTQGYQLVMPAVEKVVRTVLFAKPNVIVLLDEIATSGEAVRLDVRFFPDNQDEAAQLETGANGFVIQRPGAQLHGTAFSDTSLTVNPQQLDLPDDLGTFPYVEVQTSQRNRHAVLTVLVARPASDSSLPDVEVQPGPEGWVFDVDGFKGEIKTFGATPQVTWSS